VTVVPGAVGAWRRSALTELGGYPADTLAEDQDLTLAFQSAAGGSSSIPRRGLTPKPPTPCRACSTNASGGRSALCSACGSTGAPCSTPAGRCSVRRPAADLLFQIILTVASPLVDLAIVSSLGWAIYARAYHPVEWSPDDFIRSVFYWAAFIFLDLSAAAIGMALERRAPWRDLVWLPIQRFGYRQLMYYVVVKSVATAIRGYRVGWGKLERRATAVVGKAA